MEKPIGMLNRQIVLDTMEKEIIWRELCTWIQQIEEEHETGVSPKGSEKTFCFVICVINL